MSTIFSLCVIIFTFFFLLFLLRDTFYNLQCLMISLQPARNITEVKKTFHSAQGKKKYRVNHNQNKYSNIIIFGTKYELFLPLYQITFFLAFRSGYNIF